MDYIENAVEEARDLLDSPLSSLTRESGLRRTFPIDVEDKFLIVPTYQQMVSFLVRGNESGYQEQDSKKLDGSNLLSLWENNFDKIFYSIEPTDDEGCFVTNKRGLRSLRISAQEVVDMNLDNFHFYGRNKSGMNNNGFTAVGLQNGIYGDDFMYSPLHISSIISELNVSLYEIYFKGDVTFREAIPTVLDYDFTQGYVRGVIQHNLDFYLDIGKEDVYYNGKRFVNGFVENIITLRGNVKTSELIGWAAFMLRTKCSTQQVYRLAETTSARLAYEVYLNDAFSDADIIAMIDNNIDFQLASQLV